MRVIDTVVLFGALDPEDKHHKRALWHLTLVRLTPDVYVPSAVLMEFDMTVKSREFSAAERLTLLDGLTKLIPSGKVLPITPSILERAARFETQQKLSSYFDALVASTSEEYGAEIISTDEEFSEANFSTIW